MPRGNLILIEGLDRTGKSTQALRLFNKLNKEGHDVELIKFPERTTSIGKLINSYLVDKEFTLSDESAHLLFSANRWELASSIRKKLEEGVTIVLDRYVYSGVAYTAAKGLDREWCLNPDKGLPRPDLTLFFYSEANQNREGFGDERYEVLEFQRKVKLQFEFFFNEENWETLDIDGKSIEEIEEEVWNYVFALLASENSSAIKSF